MITDADLIAVLQEQINRNLPVGPVTPGPADMAVIIGEITKRTLQSLEAMGYMGLQPFEARVKEINVDWDRLKTKPQFQVIVRW